MPSPKKNLPPGWHSGKPPSIGWWPASSIFAEDMYRWWNGKKWSAPVSRHVTAKVAAFWAGCTVSGKDHIVYWKDRPSDWPERSKT